MAALCFMPRRVDSGMRELISAFPQTRARNPDAASTASTTSSTSINGINALIVH